MMLQKKIMNFYTLPFTVIFSFAFVFLGYPQQEIKLTLDTSMVINESGFGEAYKIIDEQTLAGDPANGTGGSPSSRWFPGWNSSSYPAHLYIDLGNTYHLNKIFIYDANGTGNLDVEYGTPGDWTNIFTDGLTGYQSWNQHNVDIDTRYIRYTRQGTGAHVEETVIYGYLVTDDDSIPPAKIVDLSIDSISKNSIKLSWTSTGNDSLHGTGDSYDIRYYTSNIDSSNYLNTKVFSHNLAPDTSSSSQSIEITNLNSRTPYYFAIKTLDSAGNIAPISNVVNGETLLDINGPIQKIMLTPEMILNETAQGDATLFVDEQTEANDPENDDGGIPTNFWEPGNKSWYYPATVVIDLGTKYLLTKLYLFDEQDFNNPHPVRVSYGKPFQWTDLVLDSLNNSQVWKEHVIDSIYTRYLRVSLDSIDSKVSEIVLYGSAQDSIESDTNSVFVPTKKTMDEFIGINAFVDDPIGRLEAFGFVREYHDWMWCEGNSGSYPGYPNNENAFSPSYPSWDFDAFYKNLKDLGITVSPSIKKNTPWMVNNDYGKLTTKPISEGDTSTIPSSYIEHADHLFQYAARYGKVQVPAADLKLASDQTKSSGLDFLDYYENWNEPDKWWVVKDDYFSPYEYAAMSSADKDGHLNSMQKKGVFTADSTAILVMAGIAKMNLDFIKAAKFWADTFRNGDFPFGVINIHHYSNNGGGQYNGGNVGVSPEADNLKSKLKEFVNYRNNNLPNVEVWISEFGYDTHNSSIQRAITIDSFSREEIQAWWIIRSYLEIAAAGIDRASLYMLRDVDVNSSITYQTSGVTEPKDSLWRAKPSWYYIFTMKNWLHGMVFDKEISSGNTSISVYKFLNLSSNQSAYAIWCPTANNTSVSDYDFNLEQGDSLALKVTFADQSIEGNVDTLTILNNTITIDVFEKPQFILTSKTSSFTPQFSTENKLLLDTSMITNESGLGDATKLVDEQQEVGNVKYGGADQPTTNWLPSWNNNDYPASSYLDFGESKKISKIFLYDTNGTGTIKISIGSPGNWSVLITDSLKNYNNWNAHIINEETQYLRITKESSNANFNEIILYGD